jgi:hypothetical protein
VLALFGPTPEPSVGCVNRVARGVLRCDGDQPTGNKLVDLASRFTLSSRWFAFALVVAVIATVRQVNDMSAPMDHS